MDRPALHVAVVLCVVLAGCGTFGSPETPTREERAESVLADASAAANATDTYRIDGTIRVEATANGRNEEVTLDLQGRVDVANRRMMTETNVQGETLESYVVDRTAYQECGMAGMWGVEDLPEEARWATTTPLSRQLSLLRSGSLSHEGTATVDGRNTTVLLGEPTTDALTQYQERRSRSVTDDAEVQNPELRVWLDADTHRPVKSRLTFEVSQGDATATARMTTRFRDYGEPMTVTVPSTATEEPLSGPCPGA